MRFNIQYMILVSVILFSMNSVHNVHAIDVVDDVPPVISITHSDGSSLLPNYPYNSQIRFNFTVYDDTSLEFFNIHIFNTNKTFKGWQNIKDMDYSSQSEWYNRESNDTSIVISNFYFKPLFAFSEGNFTFGFYAIDRAGNKSWYHQNITMGLDGFSPSMRVESMSEGLIDVNKPITISWKYSDPNPQKYPLFNIYIDTDGDSAMDMYLGSVNDTYTFTFNMPDNWTIPEKTDTSSFQIYGVEVWGEDIFGNGNFAYFSLKISIVNRLWYSDYTDPLATVVDNTEVPKPSVELSDFIPIVFSIGIQMMVYRYKKNKQV